MVRASKMANVFFMLFLLFGIYPIFIHIEDIIFSSEIQYFRANRQKIRTVAQSEGGFVGQIARKSRAGPQNGPALWHTPILNYSSASTRVKETFS